MLPNPSPSSIISLPIQKHPPCNHPKVLVVDDDAFNRIGATSLFAMIQVKVMTANDGKEALEILCQDDRNGFRNCDSCKGNFNYVLMDINMPVMNGLDSCRLFKKKVSQGLRDCLVICCSAHHTLDDVEE